MSTPSYTYVPAYKGYIADVPRVWFKRCSDGRVFYFDEITQAQATPNNQFIDINAGWSIFPVAQVPGQSSLEISLTQGQFNGELFEMNADKFEALGDSNVYETYFTETVTFPASGDNAHKATLTYEPKSASDIFIRYFDDETGEMPTITKNGKVITVPDAEGEMEVSYLTELETGSVSIINNQTSVIGEAILRWPVYNSGDDCSDSGIKGYAEMKVFRCRVSQAPGFDSSYKSAMTNQVTFATMDAKRTDGASYSIAFIEFPEEQGN